MLQILVYTCFMFSALLLVVIAAWALNVVVKSDQSKHTAAEKKAMTLYGFVPKAIRKNG